MSMTLSAHTNRKNGSDHPGASEAKEATKAPDLPIDEAAPEFRSLACSSRTESRPTRGGQVDGADRLLHVVVNQGGLGLLHDHDLPAQAAVDAAHDLVLGPRARKTGGATVVGDGRELPGPVTVAPPRCTLTARGNRRWTSPGVRVDNGWSSRSTRDRGCHERSPDPPRGAGHGCRGSGAGSAARPGSRWMPASWAARLTRFHALTAPQRCKRTRQDG